MTASHGPDDLHTRADALLDAVLDVATGERRAWLERECGDSPELHALVLRLLARIEDQTQALTAAGALKGELWKELSSELLEEVESLPPGTIVDRFRIVRPLGQGGMADVYLAERADGQFEQRVALKVIKEGLETAMILRHFERERQILAAARHPNIARLIDGGVTEAGRPYLVMEYVDGLPIDVDCDRRRLSLRQRLELFLQVTRAVDAAHRNLVVHRDIKPSNILVTGAGEVKLLDFGIARILSPDGESTGTMTSANFMTPAYASPEQILGDPVTTASDVYQLGLLLCALLTGRTPRSEARGLEALAQAVTEDGPTRPSQILTGRGRSTGRLSAEEAAAVGAARGTSIKRLRRELRGDLDNIVMMALRKEPERRYGSVAELGRDLESYLACRPVQARPDTFAYRAGKFVRRHTVSVGIAAAALAVIVALVMFHTARLAEERDRAEREAATAREVSGFLQGLFKFSDPVEARGGELTLREVLERGRSRIDELADQPLTQARLKTTMGAVYRSLGLYDLAHELIEESLDLRRRELGDDHLDVAESLVELARIERDLGSFERAEERFRGALAIYRQAGPEGRFNLAVAGNSLGMLYREQARHDEAIAEFEAALAVIEVERGEDHAETAEILNNLALVYRDQKRFAEAAEMFARLIPILRRELGEDHVHVGITVNNLGLVQQGLGRTEEAVASFQQSAEILESAFGPDHQLVGRALYNLGETLTDSGQYDRAQPLLERSLEIMRAAFGERHPAVATALFGLAQLHAGRGELEAAEALHRQALDQRIELLGADNARVTSSREALAEVLRRAGRAEEADALAAEAGAGPGSATP